MQDLRDLLFDALRRWNEGTLMAGDKQRIENAIARMSAVEATSLAGRDVEAQEGDTWPGYVRIDRAGTTLRVPGHVVPDLPPPPFVDEVLSGRDDIRIRNTDSVLCLSGSSLFGGSIVFLGDVDFCEYLSLSDGETIAQHIHAKFDLIRPDLVFLGAEDGTNRHRISRPFPDPAIDASKWRDESPWMLKFALASRSDTLPATNLGLRMDREDTVLAKSFAHQEAPIDATWFPRDLVDIGEIARYVRFLIDQVDTYSRENVVKALKRALALARILRLETTADRIVALLSRGEPVHREAERDRLALADRISGLGIPELERHATACRDAADRIRTLFEQRRKKWRSINGEPLIDTRTFNDESAAILGPLLDSCERAGL